MWLLHVKAFVDREVDIESKKATSQTKVLETCDDTTTPYAILSHRWQPQDEVDYDEMVNLTAMEEGKKREVRQREGYKKILKSCNQARADGFEWLWVDTCCIDKRSSSELSEAINSMYRWYENAAKCYAYLYDVDDPTFPTKENLLRYGKYKGWPEWFSRGWTLQELIAPRDVQFFNREWAPIGNKRGLADVLEKITRIPRNILISGLDSGVRSVAQVMSWAADRETSRVEDRAYSLLGLFGVHMPMLYGEGGRAFQRLQLEIIRLSIDHSIFAWDPEGRIRRSGSILADDPSYFRDCGGIWKMEPNLFIQRLKSRSMQDLSPGALGQVMPATLMKSVFPTVRGRALIKELNTCSIISGGLQISLPIAPHPDDLSLFRATLGCVATLVGPLMTIDLVSDSTRYYRFFGAKGSPTTFPRVKQICLCCHQGDSSRRLTFDDRTVSFYGFTRCGTFPRDIVRNTVKLLLPNDLTVVIYANAVADIRFAVGFGQSDGNAWIHVIYDESRDTPWKDYAERAYNSLWNRQSDLACSMSHTQAGSDGASFIKHAHLPRSIWAVRVVWGIWNRAHCKVTIDVVFCSGCCRGPLVWENSAIDWNGVETPGPMQAASPSSRKYGLYMDGVQMQHYLPDTQIELGDYGRCSPNFKPDGNIFEGQQVDQEYDPVKRSVSSETMAGDVVTLWASDTKFDLLQPVGLSLPNSKKLVSLLKTLSPRLVDKCLVTSVVRCETRGSTQTSLYYPLIPQVWRRDVIDEERRALFKKIRDQFYMLTRSNPTTSAGDSRPPVYRKPRFRRDTLKLVTGTIGRQQQAIQYFSDLFGIEHLESYVGKITFFEKLSLGLSPDSEAPEASQYSSISLLAKTLRGRMDKANPIRGQQMQGVKHEIEALSKTLGIRLLQEMTTIYVEAHEKLCALKDRSTRSCIEQDLSKPITAGIDGLLQPTVVSGHNRIRMMLQNIELLRTKLDDTEDIDEQLSLEEDVTGLILWTCHFGLHSAVGHIPAKVLRNVLENDEVYDLMDRVKFLEDISTVFKDALAELPTDDQAHLRRIIADAEAGISKYELLLAYRKQCEEDKDKPHPDVPWSERH